MNPARQSGREGTTPEPRFFCFVRVSPERATLHKRIRSKGQTRSICGRPRDSLVDDECVTVPRLLSVCTRTHEETHTCTQAAQLGRGIPGSFSRKGEGKLSPPFHQLWSQALKRLCADHSELFGWICPSF